MLRFGLIALGGAAVMFYLSYQEWTLATGASDKPEEITLAALIQRGPEGNPHLIISDFDSTGDMVYQEKRGTWTKVWAPITPLVKLEGLPKDKLPKAPDRTGAVQALIYSSRIHNEKELETVIGKDKIQGMVINRIESLGSKEKDLLGKKYAGTDFDRCIIFELDRAPGGGTAVVYLGIGLAAAVLGGLLLLANSRK